MDSLNCNDVQLRISMQRDEERRRSPRIDRHAAACPACRRFRRALEALAAAGPTLRATRSPRLFPRIARRMRLPGFSGR